MDLMTRPGFSTLGAKLKPAIAILCLAGAARADFEVVKSTHGNLILSGYAIGRYTYQYGDESALGAAATNTFSLRSASIIFCGDVFKYGGYFIYFDLACAKPLMDAYGTLKIIPRTEFRAGQFLVPFSRESYTSTSKLLLINRSLASVRIAPPLGRDVGAQAEFEFKSDERPDWASLALAVVNGSGPNRVDENAAKDVAVRVAGNPLPWKATEGLTLEGYYYRGKPYSAVYGTGYGDRYGGCVAFDHERFTFQGEALYRNRTFEPIPAGAAVNLSDAGYYVQASYKHPLPWPWLQIVEAAARWEHYDRDRNISGDATDAVTGGVNLHLEPGHRCKLMANYQHFIEEGEKIDNDKISAQFQVRF
jgi:hypothetical protein